MGINAEEIALGLAQDAIDSIDYMSVSEHLEFDLDNEDDGLKTEVMNIISSRVVARVE